MKLKSKLIKLSFLLFFLFVQQSWTQSGDWTIEQLTNTDERESYVVTDVDNEGNVHVAYEQRLSYRQGKTVINEERIYYTKKTNGQWATPVELGIADFDEKYPTLDVDVNGVAHIVFSTFNRDENNLLTGSFYYWNSSKDPANLVEISEFPNEIAFPCGADVVVSSLGIIHVALAATHICCLEGSDRSNIYYTSSTNGIDFVPLINLESGSDTPLDDRGSRCPSIEIDENGNIGILFTTYWLHGELPNTFSLSYTSNYNGSFDIPQIIQEGGTDAVGLLDYPPLKLFNNKAYLLFNRYNEGNPCECPGYHDLLFVKLDATSGEMFGTPMVVAQGINFSGYSMDYEVVPDGIDKLHCSYVGYYNAGTVKKPNWKSEIRYVQLDTESGDHLSPVEGINDGYNPSIALNTDGTVNISFTNNSDIFNASNDNVPPPPTGSMHVSGILMSTEVKAPRWNAVAEVSILDSDSDPVDGVLVTGNWSGLVHSDNTATTNSDGVAIFKSAKTKSSGEIIFTVMDVSKDGWTYDIASNFAYPASGSISSPLGKKIFSNEIVMTPVDYILYDNYPNPFNPTTQIRYALPEDSYVQLRIYDILGNLVMDLIDGENAAGYHEVTFNADNLSSGLYFYTIKANEFTETKKMSLLK